MKHHPVDPAAAANRFGANLRAARKRAGLSKAAMAERAELSAGNMSNIENGKHAPRADTLLKLAGALDTSIATLTDGIDWEPTIGNVAGYFVVDSQTHPAPADTPAAPAEPLPSEEAGENA